MALINLLHSAGLRFALSRCWSQLTYLLKTASRTSVFWDGAAAQCVRRVLVVSIWMFLKAGPIGGAAGRAGRHDPSHVLLSAAALTAAYMLPLSGHT